MHRFICISYLIMTNILNSVFSDVVPIQEGLKYTFMYSRNFDSRCDTFTWTQNEKPVQQCNINGSPTNSMSYTCNQLPFVREVEAKVNVNNNVVITNLTISNVYRNSSDSDEGMWAFRCNLPKVSLITTFDLRLYEKPRNLQCTPLFQEKTLNFTCNNDGIYPQGNLFVQTNNVSSGIIPTCQNILDSFKIYYRSTCNFIIPIANLHKGKLDVNLTVYPNVTNSISDNSFGKSSLFNLKLENPEVILNNCTYNNVTEGTPMSCTCERSDNSDIPTITRWLINGTDNFSSSSKISVLEILSSRYYSNYTCIAVNVFKWQSSTLIYRPSVLYAADIISLLVNDEFRIQTVVEDQSRLIIICEAMGNPEPFMYLKRDGNQLVGPTKTNFTISLTFTVSCRESGIYTCSANNTIGKISQKNSAVYVKCPQQLKDPITNKKVLTALERKDVSLNISVFGYPNPDMFDLIRNDSNKLIVNGSIPQTDVSRKYTVAYHEDDQNIIYGNLTFTIFNMSLEDFANYTLIIYNGKKGNLTYMFSIENGEFRSSRQLNEDFNWSALGGGFGAAVLVILIAVLGCIIFSRRSQKYQDDMVVITNEDLYWTDAIQDGYVNYGSKAKIYDMDYVSPITTACSPPGNYENFLKRK